jgi:hypothetical protein
MPNLVPEQPLDTVMWVTVRLHATGMVSVQGTIGEGAQARKLLQHGIDAISRQMPDGPIVVPSSDVGIVPNPALRELGDLAPHERGTP